MGGQKSVSRQQTVERSVPAGIFRQVKFRFALAGFEELKSLLKSDVRHYVVSFIYVVPKLLKTGKYLHPDIALTVLKFSTELLDFDRFRSDILTPGSYVDLAKDLYDAECDDCPSYMAIYEIVRGICREQRGIIDEGADLVLSSIFEALPLLKEVRLSFCEALEECGWVLKSLASDMIMEEEFYQHHLRVVSGAIQSARSRGVAIHTISLLDFDLPYYDPWKVPDLNPLSGSLRQLLEHIKVLRLGRSGCVLELLSHCKLNLHQLDVCSLAVEHKTLKGFLDANKTFIRSIGFHDVAIRESRRPENKSQLSASMLCNMLNVSLSTPCRAADCGCLPWWKEGHKTASGERAGVDNGLGSRVSVSDSR
ncbi:hypothetical protein OIDMADRAFT_131577 [Oidiodendron maius Zn]|uniref:Uncharacterized protein n=1 Tax=Oidiodendron maius (strain Zn) TaxID=913774 RepID=A0A0C3H081_OIDMZ|nr:hypothetical protein OIDMADRAFT_131577 [Oidiodendron maius Zn]